MGTFAYSLNVIHFLPKDTSNFRWPCHLPLRTPVFSFSLSNSLGLTVFDLLADSSPVASPVLTGPVSPVGKPPVGGVPDAQPVLRGVAREQVLRPCPQPLGRSKINVLLKSGFLAPTPEKGSAWTWMGTRLGREASSRA